MRPEPDQVALIQESINMIENKTASCIRFVKRNTSHANWVSIINHPDGCLSKVQTYILRLRA